MNRKTQNTTPAWIWFIVGLSIGLFVALLVYLTGANIKSINKSAAKNNTQKSTPDANKPRFDFYTILPELEVYVPEILDIKKSIQSSTQSTLQSVPNNSMYFLQVGSFRKNADADKRRAELAFLGFESGIQTVTVNSNRWHRVRIGPIKGKDEISRIRARLKLNNIQNMLLKAR